MVPDASRPEQYHCPHASTALVNFFCRYTNLRTSSAGKLRAR